MALSVLLVRVEKRFSMLIRRNSMSIVTKEPAPQKRLLMSDYRRELLMIDYQRHLSSVSCSRRLKKSVVMARSLAEASRDDLSMLVLLVSLLATTLLLPWVLG
jgi:hypothetical protein